MSRIAQERPRAFHGRRFGWRGLSLVMLFVLAACSTAEPASTTDAGISEGTTTSQESSTTSQASSTTSSGDTDSEPGGTPVELMPAEERSAVLDDLVDFINTKVLLDSADADQEIVAYLQERPEFVEAGLAEDGTAWGRFADGVVYSHMTRRPHEEIDRASAMGVGGVSALTLPGASSGAAMSALSAGTTGMPGVNAIYQTTSAGATLPDSTSALLMKGLSDAYPDIPVAVRSGLTKSGYQVELGGASVDDLKLAGHFDIGVLYLNTHGGVAGLWTTTPQTADNDKRYADDLAAKRLGVGSAAVAGNPNYRPGNPDCLVPDPDPQVCNAEIESMHYAIRPAFIRTYWPTRFAEGSFVILDACWSAAMAIPVGQETKVEVIAAWSDSVSAPGANRILTLFMDRLLGLNKAEPDVTPDLRPFDAGRAAQYLTELGVDGDGAARLVVSHVPASLVPSIKAITIDESKDEMIIEGMFGDEPGTVYVNGHFPDGFDWQRGVIRVPITDQMAGPVYVEQRGRRSNEVLISEWRGQMAFIGDAGPLGKDLMIEAHFDLHLRADIHMFREVPWEDPVNREVTIQAAGDSTSTWKASGTSNQTGASITASGNGEMLVEEENMSHDSALFNVRALLSIDTWDQPPQIRDATLHAHLSSEPGTEARLVFDLPGGEIDSGFPLPLTETLDPLPFEFDNGFNILDGSTSGSAPGGFGAALSWTTLISKHAPNPINPPPA